MEYFIRLNNNGFFNSSFRARKTAVRIWKEVESVFNNYPLQTFALGKKCNNGYKITLDVTDITNFFNKRIKLVKFEEDYGYYEYDVDPTFYLKIMIKGYNDSEIQFTGGERGILTINRFLQDLFLAMNLCYPTLDLWRGEIIESPSDYEIIDFTPDLSFEPIYYSWIEGRKWNYAKLTNMSFLTIWNWINNVELPGIGLANSNAQKACLLLLDLCSHPRFQVEKYLILSRGFETIFTTSNDGIARTLRERIELLLKEPVTNKKWLSKFYDIRSRIIHGDLPVTRNSFEYNFYTEEFNENYFQPYLQALSVYLCIIQKMVQKNCSGFSFTQKFSPIIAVKSVEKNKELNGKRK